MNYDIKLYAHGVPNGQSVWGVPDSDRNYIEPFYGRKSNVPVQMLVEVKQMGTSINCYYTYLRTENFNAVDGRSGGYFALTLRINYYYTDIQNVYNLLDAAYNKFIVGSIVECNGTSSKFRVNALDQENQTLISLEQEIQKYLMQFSSDADFVSLNGFKSNNLGNAQNLNLLECDTRSVGNIVKSNGNISVSPLYPTNKERQLEQKFEDEKKAINVSAQQQIVKAQQEVKSIQEEKNSAIQSLKKEYENSDKTIEALKKNVKRLEDDLSDYKNKLKSAECYKDKYNSIEKYIPIIIELEKKIGDLNINSKKQNGSTNYIESETSYSESENWIKKNKWWFPFTFLLPLLILVSIGLAKLFISADSMEKQNKNLLEKNEELMKEIKKSNEDFKGGHIIKRSQVNSQETLKGQFSNVRIDIEGNTSQWKVETRKKLTLKNTGSDNLDGKWKTSDSKIASIESDSIVKFLQKGDVTISYFIGETELTNRKITVLPK